MMARSSMALFRVLQCLLLSAIWIHVAVGIPHSGPADLVNKRNGNGNGGKQGVNETVCNGKRYVYEALAGYGFVPADAKDKYGDTLGGFGSSVALDKKSWRKTKGGKEYEGVLYALPDRGWNTQGTLNYQNRIQKFAITFAPNTKQAGQQPNVHLRLLDTILLTDPAGKPTTGLDADVKGAAHFPGFPGLPVATYTGDGFGGAGSGGKRVSLDTEGIVIAHDGSFFISDEYGPFIYQFSPSGRIIAAIEPPDAIVPHRNNSVSFSADSPPIYDPDKTVDPEDPDTGRANNQGIEGLTISNDGKTLYALLQSALDQEGGPGDASRAQTRFLIYDISRRGHPRYVGEHVVTLPSYQSKKGKKKIAAQSEIHSLGSNQFLVLARDSGAGHGQDDSQSLYRHADVFDISTASDLKSKKYDKVTGAIADADGNLNDGIKPAEYCSFLDFNVNSQLNRFGLHNGGDQNAGLLNEKWESLALAPADGQDGADGEYFLISASDNDFITQNGAMNFGKFKYKDASGFDLDNQVLIFQVQLPKGAKPS